MLLVLLIVYVILSKNDSRSNFLYPKAVAKVITFYTYFLILLKLFLKFFSRKVFVGKLLTASCKENHLNSIILPRFLFQYVISYACFPVEAGAKVLSLCLPSKSFYLFFCGFHSNVTGLLHKLLILFYLRGKTFFRFSLFIFSLCLSFLWYRLREPIYSLLWLVCVVTESCLHHY